MVGWWEEALFARGEEAIALGRFGYSVGGREEVLEAVWGGAVLPPGEELTGGVCTVVSVIRCVRGARAATGLTCCSLDFSIGLCGRMRSWRRSNISIVSAPEFGPSELGFAARAPSEPAGFGRCGKPPDGRRFFGAVFAEPPLNFSEIQSSILPIFCHSDLKSCDVMSCT